MEVQLSDLAPALQTLFTSDAEAAALASGLVARRRKVTGPALAQGLVFGWLQQPRAGTAALLPSLARAGVKITAQSLDARFTPRAADFLRSLLDKATTRLLAPPSRAFGLLSRFKGVYLTDCTSIALPAALAADWPGCKGDPKGDGGKAAMKVLVRHEVSGGAITGLSLHAGKASDAEAASAHAPHPPGSLRLADLGFFGLDALAACVEGGAHYITRVKGICLVYDGRGRKWKLSRYLARQRCDRLDREVWLGEGRRLKGRLLAIRAPEAVAEGRRAAARETARDRGARPTEGTLSACGWTVFFTDVPRWVLTLQEAWVMYRVRWQAELLFKAWKSDGLVDEAGGAKPARILCEVLAKLLGAAVQGWLLAACGGAGMGEKSRRAAACAARQQVAHVAAAMRDLARLAEALAVMAAMVAAAPGVRRRRGRPATFQTLLDPFNDGLSSEAGQDPRAEPSYEDEGGDDDPPARKRRPQHRDC